MAVAEKWALVVVGVAVIVCAGIGSLLVARSGSTSTGDSSPFPVGEVFTDSQWSAVETSLAARGLDGKTARVVSGLRLHSTNEPFALVRATSPSRGICFLPVRGARPGSATCSADGRLKTALLAFGAVDGSGASEMTSVVGVARHSIVGVSVVDRHGFGAGLTMVPTAGGLWSFTGGYGATKLTVRALLASNRVAARTTVP